MLHFFLASFFPISAAAQNINVGWVTKSVAKKFFLIKSAFFFPHLSSVLPKSLLFPRKVIDWSFFTAAALWRLPTDCPSQLAVGAVRAPIKSLFEVDCSRLVVCWVNNFLHRRQQKEALQRSEKRCSKLLSDRRGAFKHQKTFLLHSKRYRGNLC